MRQGIPAAAAYAASAMPAFPAVGTRAPGRRNAFARASPPSSSTRLEARGGVDPLVLHPEPPHATSAARCRTRSSASSPRPASRRVRAPRAAAPPDSARGSASPVIALRGTAGLVAREQGLPAIGAERRELEAVRLSVGAGGTLERPGHAGVKAGRRGGPMRSRRLLPTRRSVRSRTDASVRWFGRFGRGQHAQCLRYPVSRSFR